MLLRSCDDEGFKKESDCNHEVGFWEPLKIGHRVYPEKGGGRSAGYIEDGEVRSTTFVFANTCSTSVSIIGAYFDCTYSSTVSYRKQHRIEDTVT